MRQRNSIIIITLVSALILLFWVGGGFEMFKPPIEIVLPENFAGVVCAESLPNSSEKQEVAAHYEVLSNGLLLVDGDILRSHRKRKLFSKGTKEASKQELPANTMFPILTENDATTHKSYTVYWVGSQTSWQQSIAARSGKPLCLGRY
jgi:hypothetical protein